MPTNNFAATKYDETGKRVLTGVYFQVGVKCCLAARMGLLACKVISNGDEIALRKQRRATLAISQCPVLRTLTRP